MESVRQPLEVREGRTGKGVFACGLINPGEVLLQFCGPVTRLENVPHPMLNYVVRVERSLYLIPEPPTMYVNHSCEPNCWINDKFEIVSRQTILPGDELTISYNRISALEDQDWGDFWHDAWTFPCSCGTWRCIGLVDRYLVDEVVPEAPELKLHHIHSKGIFP